MYMFIEFYISKSLKNKNLNKLLCNIYYINLKFEVNELFC